MNLTPHNRVTQIVEVNTPGLSEVYTNVPNPTTVVLLPSGGLSTIEYTLDPDMADWRPWAKGQLGVYAEDVLIADVVGIRLNVASGTAKMYLIGGRNG